MPTYDYLCEACEEEFQATHKMSDPPLSECPNCGAKGQVRRLMGAGAGLIFKGSGFYITDYRDKPKSADKAEAGAEKAEKSEKSADKAAEPKKGESPSAPAEPKKAAAAPETSSGSKPAASGPPAGKPSAS